jgi:hypothetical protein
VAYRDLELSAQVRFQPAVARSRILREIGIVGGDFDAAAKNLGVARRTFSRMITTLGIRDKAEKLRAQLPYHRTTARQRKLRAARKQASA